MTDDLAVRRHCLARLRQQWPMFLATRGQRLAPQERFGKAAERVTEEILADLFTVALDWPIASLNHQVGYADLVLTGLGIKYLIVEAKRPGALAWHDRAVRAALEQAHRYAHEQKVRCVAASDGIMLYAADVAHGGLQDRAFVSLAAAEPPEDLWWLSVHGIYRPRDALPAPLLPATEPGPTPREPSSSQDAEAALMHPHYKLPASCFAYVGDPAAPSTWKLPYLHADGTADLARLPKAIQAVLTNYRGAKVAAIPESAIPEVLVRLGRTAARVGKLPSQDARPAPAYRQLVAALEQIGRLRDIFGEPVINGPATRSPAPASGGGVR